MWISLSHKSIDQWTETTKSSQKFVDALPDNLTSRFDESDDEISSFDIPVPTKFPSDEGELVDYGTKDIRSLSKTGYQQYNVYFIMLYEQSTE